MSDFGNIAESGKACVGCGRGVKEGVLLKRLRTYSRAYGCYECMLKHMSCQNVSLVTGERCNHEPHLNGNGVCQHCGCAEYIHGLENEMDRQFANCVGKPKGTQFCQGYGQNLGNCGRLIFLGSDGLYARLCQSCMARLASEWNAERRG